MNMQHLFFIAILVVEQIFCSEDKNRKMLEAVLRNDPIEVMFLLQEEIEKEGKEALEILNTPLKDCDWQEYTEEVMYFAIRKCPEAIRLMNQVNEEGDTLLSIFLHAGDEPMVQFLITYGADPNLRHEKTLRTPFSWALENFRISMALLLLDNGARAERGDLEFASNRSLRLYQEVKDNLKAHGWSTLH